MNEVCIYVYCGTNPPEDFSLAMYSLFEALAAFISKPRKLTKLFLPTEMSQFLEPVLSLGLGSSPNTLSPNMELTMENIYVYYIFSSFGKLNILFRGVGQYSL